MRVKKRKKASRMRGRHQGTHGGGARKKRKKSGHKGGIGMAGSGKRADHKKTLITKLYGNSYFGKKGVTSRGTKRDKRDRISLENIDKNIDRFVAKGFANKTKDGFEVNLPTYKILGSSKDYSVKNKLKITAKEASKSVIEKVKKASGEVIIKSKKNLEESKE